MGAFCGDQWGMVGDDCGRVWDKWFDDHFGCGGCRGHVAVTDGAWRGMFVDRFRTRDSIIILIVV